ncbi:MAG: FHA domain-containing protein [Planctomycetes bacterium]|nr:FHA domain-containing protein [Planctomycetota bacterium]
MFPRPLALLADRTYVLGRAGKADLPIPSDRISRRHASLSWDEGRLLVCDLGSTNGTLVEGRALVKGKRVALRGGARFSLGGFEIEVLALRAGVSPSSGGVRPDAPTREHVKKRAPPRLL